MTSSDLERRDARDHLFRRISNNAGNVWPRTTEFGRITHVGEGCISRGSATPLPQGAGPKRNAILGVPFYLYTHPLTQNYQIWRGNTCGRGLLPPRVTIPNVVAYRSHSIVLCGVLRCPTTVTLTPPNPNPLT